MVLEIIDDCDISSLEMDIIIAFDAEVTHPTIKHWFDLEVECGAIRRTSRYSRGVYECRTRWLLTTMSELATTPLGEYLRRYLNEHFPDFTFDKVNITGYEIRMYGAQDKVGNRHVCRTIAT